MTFRRWISELRPAHLPFTIGLVALIHSLFLDGPWADVYQLLGVVAVSSGFAIGAGDLELRRHVRRELRVLWDDLPPRIADAVIERRRLELKQDPPTGAVDGSSHPTSKEEHQ